MVYAKEGVRMGVRFGCTRMWVYVALAIPSLIHADNQKKIDYRRLSRRRLAEAGELQRTREGGRPLTSTTKAIRVKPCA